MLFGRMLFGRVLFGRVLSGMLPRTTEGGLAMTDDGSVGVNRECRLVLLVAGSPQLPIGHPHVEVTRFTSTSAVAVFTRIVPTGLTHIQMSQLGQDAFDALNPDGLLVDGFMGGDAKNWYPLFIETASTPTVGDSFDFTPDFAVTYDFASIAFAGVEDPSDAIISVTARLMAQWRMLAATILDARATLAQLATDAQDAPLTQKQILQETANLRRVRSSLAECQVVLDPRPDCYSGYEFDFVDLLRSSWKVDALSQSAADAVTACRDALDDLAYRMHAKEQRRVNLVLQLLTVASGLTAVFAVLDFGASTEPLTVRYLIRTAIALAVVALAIVLALQLRRRSDE